MYKYLGSVLDVAALVGEIEKIEMEGADRYYPAHIEVTGKTADGDAFEIYMKVGEKLRGDS